MLDFSGQYYAEWGGRLHTFSLTLENATDAVYRNHLNRVKEILPEPGRNLRPAAQDILLRSGVAVHPVMRSVPRANFINFSVCHFSRLSQFDPQALTHSSGEAIQ